MSAQLVWPSHLIATAPRPCDCNRIRVDQQPGDERYTCVSVAPPHCPLFDSLDRLCARVCGPLSKRDADLHVRAPDGSPLSTGRRREPRPEPTGTRREVHRPQRRQHRGGCAPCRRRQPPNTVVAATADDDATLLVCQTARTKFGVENVFARGNDSRNVETSGALSVTAVDSHTATVFALDNEMERPGLAHRSTMWATATTSKRPR